jgi:hypothetical protein
MSIQDWATIGEILSSIAILITLVYLAIQTRQNTEAVRASTRQAIVAGDLELVSLGVAYPSIDQSMYKPVLTDDEKTRLEWWLIGLCRSREYQWFQFRAGQLDRQAWESNLSALGRNLTFARTNAWWKSVSDTFFDRGFVREVNRYLVGIPVVPEYTHTFDKIEI